LRHLEQRAADPVTIADADLVVSKTIDGQIFAELTVFKVLALQLLLPIAVGSKLIDHYGAVLSAVPCQISLPVAIQVQAPCHHPAGDRLFPDTSVNQFSLPLDIAGKTNIHGDN
jgi:hypothetical protein